jgi:2-polyprenyl-6-methoxyphenol hydroxylase-like FAD-dependent oxidoreductase
MQYKFSGISPRSMEIFRTVGIEAEIRGNTTGDQQAGGIARGQTLNDPNISWMRGAAWKDVGELGPCQPATCDQHRLEPILRAHAENRGAEVQFGTEVISFTQDAESVTAQIRQRDSGEVSIIHASYLIAADGANGSIREQLGIAREGTGELQHFMNIIFDTDLKPFIGGKRFTSCFVMALNGTITTREEGRWLLALPYDPRKGERPEDFNAARCRELVRRGAGDENIKADLVDARPWEVAALVAKQFSQGRVFLVGDAAHVMPPTGAFGGNTGIHDAHNLAWKIAAVLGAVADPALLDTYDSERRSVAQRTLAQALARLQAWFKGQSKDLPPPEKIIDDYDVVFGQRYENGALIPEDDAPTRAFEPARELSGRPGTRAPHLPIGYQGKECSTLDLFGKDFVLLTGSKGALWRDAASRLTQNESVPLVSHGVASDGDVKPMTDSWDRAYGLNEDGAMLVRPDGFVAWRSRGLPENASSVLAGVFHRLHVFANNR